MIFEPKISDRFSSVRALSGAQGVNEAVCEFLVRASHDRVGDGVESLSEVAQAAYRSVVSSLAAGFRDAGLRLAEDDLERLFEAGLFPGSDEVVALVYIARYADAEYDHAVFDTAPTGPTLRLLDLPAVLSETFGVAGEVRQRVRRTARAARSAVFGPAAYWGSRDDAGGDAIASLRDRIHAVDDLLRDPTARDSGPCSRRNGWRSPRPSGSSPGSATPTSGSTRSS